MYTHLSLSIYICRECERAGGEREIALLIARNLAYATVCVVLARQIQNL